MGSQSIMNLLRNLFSLEGQAASPPLLKIIWLDITWIAAALAGSISIQQTAFLSGWRTELPPWSATKVNFLPSGIEKNEASEFYWPSFSSCLSIWDGWHVEHGPNLGKEGTEQNCSGQDNGTWLPMSQSRCLVSKEMSGSHKALCLMVFGVALRSAPTQAQAWTPTQIPYTLIHTTLQASTSLVWVDGLSIYTKPFQPSHFLSVHVLLGLLAQLHLWSNIPAPSSSGAAEQRFAVWRWHFLLTVRPAQLFHLGFMQR